MAWPSCRITCLVTLGAALWLPHGQASPERLRTVATLSPRPVECVSGKRDGGVWRAAADVGSARACWQLARINGMIQREPKAASELLAQLRADVSLATTWLRVPSLDAGRRQLEGRVALAAGEFERAWEVFESSRQVQALSSWPSLALRDYAVSAAMTGRVKHAATLYRRVMTVAAWLPARERSAVHLEAAMALIRATEFTAGGPSSPGAANYFEAAAYVETLDAQRTDTRVTELATAIDEIAKALAEASAQGAAMDSAADKQGAAMDSAADELSVTREHGAARGADAASAGSSSEGPYSGRSLRGGARLPEQDWRLIETWIEWRKTQDVDVWAWLSDASAPGAFRALAQRANSRR